MNDYRKLPSFEKRWLKDMPSDKEISTIKPTGNLYNYLYECNKNNMNNIAISVPSLKIINNNELDFITYEELFENIDKCVSVFKNIGIEKGDIVPLVMLNIPEASYCLYALNKIGAISCFIDPRMNEFCLKRDIDSVDSKVLLSITYACKKIKNITFKNNLIKVLMLSTMASSSNTLLKKVLGFQEKITGNSIPKRYMNFPELLDNEEKVLQPNDGLDETSASIVFTGGTTGTHKGVLLSNKALNTTVFEHNYLIDNISKGEKFLDILPPFIAYGLTSLHLSLCLGLETILDPVPIPNLFAKKIEKYKPSVAFGGPIHWEHFAMMTKAKDLSFLKYPVSGGEKLPESTAKKINEVLRKKNANEILDGYGATETCGVFSIKMPKNTPNTVGYPLRYNNVCIVDSDTIEEKDYNQSGEILISGPSIMECYYQKDEENDKVFITDKYGRKWFRTGDTGMINEKGELIITGRLKRIFVCGVTKVYPPELEEIIMEIEGIKKCVVTGVNDERLRTVPKVHLIKEQHCSYSNQEIETIINEQIKERVGEEAVPKYYSFDNDFLYTPSGKVDFTAMTKNDNQKILIKKRT